MSNVVRNFVGLPSATAGRNGAGFHPCQGLYYRPETSAPTTAFIASHYNVDFSEHYLAEFLAERGFGFLGWNTRFRGNEAFFLLEHALVDIAAGIEWLKTVAGVEKVILLGNSGGGSLMAAYQSQAREVDMQPAFGVQLPDALGELPRGDAYVSLCAHRGRPEVLTDWMDPAVVSEADPVPTDPALDIYDPRNGPPYDEAFLSRYRAAQVQRNERISSWAVVELERVQAAGLSDRVFVLHRVWADPRFMDPEIDPSERPPGRCYAGDPKRANYSAPGLGVASTLRTWLAMWSLSHSSCRGELHLPKIVCPALVVQADADCGVFPSEARAILAALGSRDKRLEVIAGDHYLATPESARSDTAELICNWLADLSW